MDLDRAAIFDATDLVIEKVAVKEWGGDVYVKGITGEERDAFEASFITTKGNVRDINYKNMRAQLVARAACTADGTRIFTDNDAALLGRKSAAALDRVYAVAARLAGISKEDEEQLVQDFTSAQSEPSTTTSPES
jgi:hypothetical protein